MLLLIGLAIGVRLFLMHAAHATEEDFFITLRYAQNLAHGRGFVYNPGARVLGTTTPLYTLLLALLIRLRLDPILCGKLLGIAADALSCYAVYRLGRSIGRPGAGLAAALCLALLPTNLIWATKGMEVELVAAASAVAWAAWAERMEIAAWAATAVLVLLRIDGAALALFLLLGTLWRDRRFPWRGGLLFILLLLPWLTFAAFYFGSPIPASLQAKLIVYGRSTHGPFPRLSEFVSLMTHHGGVVLVIGCLCAFVALLRKSRGKGKGQREKGKQGTGNRAEGEKGKRRKEEPDSSTLEFRREWMLILPGLWLISYYGSMALSNVFLFGWYFVPPTPLYYLISMVGWSLLLEGKGEREKEKGFDFHLSLPNLKWNGNGWQPGFSFSLSPFPFPLVLAAALLIGWLTVPHVLEDLRRTQAVEDEIRIPIGRWLRAHGRPADTVMLEPIGYIGYYSGLRVLDTVALVSPEVLPLYGPQYPSPRHEMWQRYRPEWILLRAGEWQDLRRYEATLPPSERLESRYHLVRTWSDPAIPGSGPSFYLFHNRGS